MGSMMLMPSCWRQSLMTGFRDEQTYIIDTPMPKDRVFYVVNVILPSI